MNALLTNPSGRPKEVEARNNVGPDPCFRMKDWKDVVLPYKVLLLEHPNCKSASGFIMGFRSFLGACMFK